MTSLGILSRGDIVLVRFPFTDLSSDKVRPALVAGRVSGDDLILAFITSRLRVVNPLSDYLLDPSDREFDTTGLKVPSIIRPSKLVTLHRELVRRRLGWIGSRTATAVANALRHVFEL